MHTAGETLTLLVDFLIELPMTSFYGDILNRRFRPTTRNHRPLN